MSPEEAKSAFEARARVTVDVAGNKHEGTIRELGEFQSILGPGTLSRAAAVVETDLGDLYTHIKDLSLRE